MSGTQPFKWNQSSNIPKLKPTNTKSPKYVDHISVGSCVAIPEDFVVNHRTQAKQTDIKEIKKMKPIKPNFSQRTSSLQCNTHTHSRYPSNLIPVEMKEELKLDRDWATNLLNNAFNM